MRSLLVLPVLLSCNGGSRATMTGAAGSSSPGPAVEPPSARSTAIEAGSLPDQEGSAGASAADSGSSAPGATTLVDLSGDPPARYPGGGVLLCKSHQVWTPPPGFTLAKVDHGAAARSGARLVAVTFPPSSEDAATVAGRFVKGGLAWEVPALTASDAWHAEALSHGRAAGMVVATRTLYAGIDRDTRKGRPLGPTGVVWIAAAPTEKEADELLAQAKAGTLMLVDHACACGYDCARRRPARP